MNINSKNVVYKLEVPMKLSDLAFTSHVYNYFTNYNTDYHNLINNTNHEIDLHLSKHRQALIDWLNQWGCRQFAVAYHEMASKGISSWYEKCNLQLIAKDKMLWGLTENDFVVISNIFDALAANIASQKQRNGSKLDITIGPTGASKILFALRPNSLIPWDEPIRKLMKYRGDGNSYIDYLRRAKKEADSLFLSCENNNIEPIDIPRKLRRPEASIAQLIGEYFWVIITRECCPPSNEIFEEWAHWCKR